MVFRAAEAAKTGAEQALRYLVPRPEYSDEKQRARAREAVQDILDKYGPVVDGYPRWHPLVRHHDDRNPETTPNDRCGYKGLDHTVYFAKAFVTCPYRGSEKGSQVLDSVRQLSSHPVADIRAETLDVPLYNPGTTTVLVTCEWQKPLLQDGTIPLAIAAALLLEREIPCCRFAKVAENWNGMLPYFLGAPHGRRSSQFLNQETGQALKKLWETIIQTGMFGPIIAG